MTDEELIRELLACLRLRRWFVWPECYCAQPVMAERVREHDTTCVRTLAAVGEATRRLGGRL